MKIILASQSPRRRELLERMGITDLEVIPAEGEEIATRTLTTDQLVEELSRHKCAEVAASRPEDLVIAADTLVEINGRVLGKPVSEEDAACMLAALSIGSPVAIYRMMSAWLRVRKRTEVISWTVTDRSPRRTVTPVYTLCSRPDRVASIRAASSSL